MLLHPFKLSKSSILVVLNIHIDKSKTKVGEYYIIGWKNEKQFEEDEDGVCHTAALITIPGDGRGCGDTVMGFLLKLMFIGLSLSNQTKRKQTMESPQEFYLLRLFRLFTVVAFFSSKSFLSIAAIAKLFNSH